METRKLCRAIIFWGFFAAGFANDANAVSFVTAINYDVGGSPGSVATGDFDGDGKTDLAIANRGGNDVSVLLNNGDGAFHTAVNYEAGSVPYEVITGDFNSDGKTDLAVVNRGSGNVSILVGNGDGTFQTAVNYSAGTYSTSVTSGDFNSDGKTDLAVTNQESDNVSIFLGNGDGTFQTAVNHGAENPRSVTTGDFNGDGNTDLTITSSWYNNISVLLGNGDGTFQISANYSAGTAPVSVITGDYNGDGKTDLAVANQGSYPLERGSVSVFLGNGDGTFRTSVDYNAGNGPVSMKTGDFNSDGKTDLAASNNRSDNVSILLGNGDGTFQTSADYSAGNGAVSVATGDFNGDGSTDLCTANEDGQNVSILFGNGDGTFQATLNYTAGTSLGSMATGDFNGDGKTDLAVANYDYGIGEYAISIFLGNGDGTFQPAVNYSDVGDGSHYMATGDFNGDGKTDLAVSSYDKYWSGKCSISIFLGNGDGTFQTTIKYDADNLSLGELVTGDFNGDGKTDIASSNNGENGIGSVSIFLGNGDGTFQVAVNYDVGAFSLSLTTGDFNGDGKTDIASSNNGENGIGSVSIFLGNGDGTFQAAVNYVVGQIPGSVVAEDFNGDGSPDLAALNISEYGVKSTISLLLGKGDGTFRRAVNYIAGSDSYSVTTGDFNSDGKIDLAAANNGGHVIWEHSISILLGNGDGTFLPPVNFGAGPSYSMIKGDFNGDGKTDLSTSYHDVNIWINDTVIMTAPAGRIFGDLNVGDISGIQTFTLTNGGTADVLIGNVSLAGLNAEDFTMQSDVCAGATLPPAGTCSVDVVFNPKSIGTKNAAILVHSKDLLPNPDEIPLKGSAVHCPEDLYPLTFFDVDGDYWAEAFIKTLSCNGVTVGFGGGLFGPGDMVLRAQMAVFILKAIGQAPADECTGAVFADVNADTVGEGFCRYIEKFSTLSITAGCGNSNYCPYDMVSRAQMAVFITKALGGLSPADSCSGTVFLDVKADYYGVTEQFCRYIEKFEKLQITSGCGGGYYCPGGVVTRAEMAVFLTKAFLQ